jgi:hypothetical protein
VIFQEILLFCRDSAKWLQDRSNARSQMMKNCCWLSVNGLQVVDSMIKMACCVEVD